MGVYSIKGDVADTARVMILNEADWSMESNTIVSGANSYDIEVEAGPKTVIARRISDAEATAYGNVTPHYIAVPPEMMDLTSYHYWRIINGTWDDDNARWAILNTKDQNVELETVDLWPEDYRPTTLRITHTSNYDIQVILYDTEDNVIANELDVDKTDQVIDITWSGYDIGRIKFIQTGAITTAYVTKIEFFASPPLKTTTDYDVIWSATNQHVDFGGAMDDDLIAIKLPDVTNTGRQILADKGISSGNYYFEVRMRMNGTALTNCSVGVRHIEGEGDGGNYSGFVGSSGSGWGFLAQGRFYRDGSLRTADPNSWGSTSTWETIGVAVNMTLGYIWFSRNGVWQAWSGGQAPNPGTGTDPAMDLVTGTVYPAITIFYHSGSYLTEGVLQATVENIEYSIPNGFLAWDSTA